MFVTGKSLFLFCPINDIQKSLSRQKLRFFVRNKSYNFLKIFSQKREGLAEAAGQRYFFIAIQNFFYRDENFIISRIKIYRYRDRNFKAS